MTDTLTGTLHTIKFRSKELDNDYVIATLTTGETIKGEAPDSEFIIGSSYTFEGTWQLGREWQGKRQKEFTFKRFTRAEPATRRGLVFYLEKFCPGIGPTLANRIFDEFRELAVKTLRTSPAEVADKVKGIDLETAQTAAKELQKNVKFEETRIELAQLFQGRGFSKQLTNMALKKWGIHAASRIKRDPFCLLVESFPSAGFARCDRLYMDLGRKPGRLKRLMLCIWHQIRESMEGHTWFPAKQILDKLRRDASAGLEDFSTDAVQKADQRILKAVSLGVRAGWLMLRRTSEGIFIAEGQAAENEGIVAMHVARLLYQEEQPEVEDVLLLETAGKGEEVFQRREEEQAESLKANRGDYGSEIPVETLIQIGKQTGVCQFCHRQLDNPESIRRGYGPTCAQNRGLPWGNDGEEEGSMFVEQFEESVS
jgi:hypothetical protein